MNTVPVQQDRIVFLDYLRAAACCMVILIHSFEFYYIGEGGKVNFSGPEATGWVTWFASALRIAVPLFVMVSSYLLVPLRESPGQFYRRRFTRVVIPFAIWSLLYALLPLSWGEISTDQATGNLQRLLYNFTDASGHLWFVYMLLGLYLFMPVISPWLRECSRKFELAFLAVWFLTTFYHYGRELVPGFYGECDWNEFGTLWYFSGFIGYVVLGHYIRTYIHWSPRRSVVTGLLLFLAGYAITAGVFHHRTETAVLVPELELSWRFCTFNVALMCTGIFLLFKALPSSQGRVYAFFRKVSEASYGMYLMHIFFLNMMFKLLNASLPFPISTFAIGISTIVITYLIARLLSIPRFGKYLIG